MLKKLLILPILGSILGLGAFASADTVDGFTSSSNICSVNFSNSDDLFPYVSSLNSEGECFEGMDFYYCVSSSDTPYQLYHNSSSSSDNSLVNVSNSNYCYPYSVEDGDNNIYVYSDYDNSTEKSISGKFYISSSAITYSSSSDSSDSSFIPSIPSSFTSGLTSLISNFGGIIVNWLPTIILLSLGITAIFALFRVVRNYARSTFNG